MPASPRPQHDHAQAGRPVQGRRASGYESEETYRALIEMMDQGVALCELVRNDQGEIADYRFLALNAAFGARIGRDRTDVVGRLRSEVVPADDGGWIRLYGPVVATGKPVHTEYYSTELDRWFEVRVMPWGGDRFAVLSDDISQRKLAEAERERFLVAVEQRAAELDTVMSTIADPFVVYDAEGKVVRANAAAIALFGADPRTDAATVEATRRSLRPLDGSSVSRNDLPLARALTGETVIGELYHYRNVPGQEFIISVAAAPLHDGDVVHGAVTLWHDVTDRLQAEAHVREDLEVRVAERTAERAATVEELRTSEERVRLLLEQMPVMLWTTDREMRVTALLGASFPAWHATQLPFEGRGVAELFAETDVDGTAEPLHRKVLEGTPAKFEFLVDSHTYEAHVEPLHDAGGEAIGTIGVAHDVSDRTLRKLQEDFIASVSHELQTPLTAIRAGLGLLETAVGSTLGPAERELLSASRRNAERLRLQIAQLLQANQVIVGERQEVKRLVIDLREVVEGAKEAVRPLLQEKEQTIDVDMPEQFEVEGDRQLMAQVLGNLLSNAHRHTPHGTHLAVSGWFVGDQVRLAVHDTGPGIPVDRLESIFQRFYRAPGALREGIGLGLAIARSAVEAQGGRLWAESSPGHGTTFIVSLPRAPEDGFA